MAGPFRLQPLRAADLDPLIAELKDQGATELVLLGPLALILNQSPDNRRQASVIYQLQEVVPELAQRLSPLTQLTSLNLGSNPIGAAGVSSLAALSQLTSLHLSGNNIGDAGASFLTNLSQLTSLKLWGNKISDSGAASLASLTGLTTLHLGGNEIGRAGAASLSAMTQLKSLNLGGNEIGAAGAASLAALTQLRSLNLWGNEIGAVGAASLAPLTKLTDLNLKENWIGDAGAASLAALTQLTSLDLRDNRIGDQGAASLAALSQLLSLGLGDNQIGDAGSSSLAALTQLASLKLWNNRISDSGAAGLAALNQLTSLNLRDNKIGNSGVSYLSALLQLEFLNLGYNKIGDAGVICLADLTQLTSLNLSGNQIGDVGAAALADLSHLKFLGLGNTRIVDLKPLLCLRNLKTLDLRRSKVQDLTPLKPLLETGLHAKWEKNGVDGLNVYGCPLVHPPPEIVQQGQEAVLNYLREIETQGEDRLYEAKVLILGEGSSGKTSLLRRLYQPALPLPAEEETTKGIDIHRHEFKGQHGQPFRLNVWDFGGQQIYHATHQFFLTKRSMYVLLDDTRSNNKSVHDEGFKYWLEMIETLSEASPVLIFQNEKAGRSKSIDEAGIKGRFPNVMEVHAGNLENRDSTAALAEAIRYHVQQLPHVGEAVPAQWLKIRLDIDELKQDNHYITLAQYFQVYSKHLPADRDKALKLSRYLHDLGVFLHFQEDPLLGRTVILQNDWATEAVFKVLDDEPTKASKGYFNRQDCARIWADSTYAEMHPELLALMEKFELCYQLPDQNIDTWLTPQLLSPSAPQAFTDWAQADDLVFTYQYDFLPKGLISRLMVRMHRFVRRPELCWGSGALFEQGSTQLLASLASPSGQEIELRARGPEAKALRDVIASDLDALNATFEGLRGKVRKLVPCICSQCRQSTNPARYEEQRLLKRKQDRRLSIECPDSYQDVSVLELLDGLRIDTILSPPKKGTRAAPDPQPVFKLPGRTARIFLASSSELRAERDALDLYLRQQNDRLRQSGLYLEVMRWETFLDAMSDRRLQEEYNNAVRNCDIFLSLFKTKTGKYTEEEFDVAHQAFKADGKPLIYTYFMKTDVPNDKSMREALNSLWRFQEKLSQLGHYHTETSSIQALQLQFRTQLDLLISEGKL
ncbi:MAG: COR domain-containing protein [Cyanobacteriota bacterium]|nr:COR domain-containing protein [Cyanobacteriota bacterium]